MEEPLTPRALKRPVPHYPVKRQRYAWYKRLPRRTKKFKSTEEALKRLMCALSERRFDIFILRYKHSLTHPLNFLALRKAQEYEIAVDAARVVLCRVRQGYVLITPLQHPTAAIKSYERKALQAETGGYLQFAESPYNPRRGKDWQWFEMVLKRDLLKSPYRNYALMAA